MHGTNKVRKPETRNDGFLQVREAFYTLQGEGPHAGTPAMFLRLTGCNLRCWFCDTAWDDDKDHTYSPVQTAEMLWGKMPGHCRLLVITGGEPLRQPLRQLLKILRANASFDTIQVETAGTLWQDCLTEFNVEIIVSPKTPSINRAINERAKAFKYVVRADDLAPDGLPYATTQMPAAPALVPGLALLARPKWNVPVYLSPCDEQDPAKNAANLRAVRDSALKHGYRAGVQLHKLLDVP
jgi:7-carboxy-7-deazaguanine synthase